LQEQKYWIGHDETSTIIYQRLAIPNVSLDKFLKNIWFGLEMSPKSSCVEGLVPSAAVVRDAAFEEVTGSLMNPQLNKLLGCNSVEVTDDSNQKILVLALWQGRIQTEHIFVVREIMEFYCRKGGLCKVKWEKKKKGSGLF
jgi:hypothetical protein